MRSREETQRREDRALQLKRKGVDMGAIAERLGVHRKSVWPMIRAAEGREVVEKTRSENASKAT